MQSLHLWGNGQEYVSPFRGTPHSTIRRVTDSLCLPAASIDHWDALIRTGKSALP
jgi:hypothetical protein